jgi:hypothetical protein
MWALLALYQALRTAITDAIQTVPGTGTDRGSCQIAVETAGILATSARNVTGKATDLVGDVGRVLANLHGPRRPASAPARSDPLYPATPSIRPANRAVASGSPRSPPRSTSGTSRRRHADRNT